MRTCWQPSTSQSISLFCLKSTVANFDWMEEGLFFLFFLLEQRKPRCIRFSVGKRVMKVKKKTKCVFCFFFL